VADNRDKELVFRPLHESPIVSVHDYCCHIARGGPGDEEESDANNIVVMRHGAGDKLMNTSKCPVCDWAINDGGIKVTVAGKEITVCCDECVEKAKENPAQYAAAE
jgi:YHS domain-containing protein